MMKASSKTREAAMSSMVKSLPRSRIKSEPVG
jgi:hypothetical protein